MKVPYTWLAEWVDVPWEARELGMRLTMSGFELETIEPAAPDFTNVVVAEILAVEPHPQADKLRVCRVSTGQGEPLQIVCGAPNARAGLKSALAVIGAKLPGDVRIKAAKLRGVESFGMLCSARELGLGEGASGIMELPEDAPLGKPLREYLALDDVILELNVTPNRGDAMSILGIAREVAALADRPIGGPAIDPVAAAHGEKFPIYLDAPAACPKFVGRVIRGVNNKATTPVWLRERLRRAGVRSVSPVVDVTNYVMLELGQPMHAYDLAKLRGRIGARMARAGEQLTLLDGRTIEAQSDVLVIADEEGAVGLAGIMGGERTAIAADTTDVFLEVAYFTPDAILGRARRWGLVTDAGQRFERGVDPTLQERAMERATALILAIAGGQAGPVEVVQSTEHLPRRSPVRLRRSRLERVLGLSIEPARVEQTLRALQMTVEPDAEGWQATPPAHRFDIAIEEDLVEEVARIVGLDAIPETVPVEPRYFRSLPEAQPAKPLVLEALVQRGYQEVVTFAFVDPALQKKLFPDVPGLRLANPIASDLSVMRVSLWPGLLRAALENQRRQQDRIRLFEHGARFVVGEAARGAQRSAEGNPPVSEIESLAGIACGLRLPEQWGVPAELKRAPVDFYDVKGDLESLFAATGRSDSFVFEAAELPCLHPGRTARILRDGEPVGWIGELHPALVRELEFTTPPVLFELDLWPALRVDRKPYEEISRYPSVRRDLSVIVDESVALSALRDRVTLVASSLLRNCRVFDVYRGAGVESGRKSIALGLIFQDISRTLTDEDVDRAVDAIVTDLRVSLNAKIRE